MTRLESRGIAIDDRNEDPKDLIAENRQLRRARTNLERKLTEVSAERDALQASLDKQVTELRVAEHNIKMALGVLNEERRRLKSILHSIGQGVVVTDDGGKILLINDIAADFLEYPADEAIGLNLLDVIESEDFRLLWNETADGGEFAKQPLALDIDRPRFLWATRTAFDTSNAESGYVTILQDMTREREIDRMKTDFVSSVSHDLRTPLTSIKGFIATILRNPQIDADRLQEFLRIANRESDRLIALIDDLLEISKLETGAVKLNLEPYRIDALIERLIDTVQPLLDEKKHWLKFRHDQALPELIGDRVKLQTVMHNLLGNAVKYTPVGGELEIRTALEGDELRVDVMDDGPGIPAEDQPNIFERFYRSPANRRLASGTGLGLHIVKELVELHGGRVEVISAPGQGSQFSVFLPLQPEPIEA